MSNPTQPAAARRKACGMPYLMPDGRPLGDFLVDNNLLVQQRRRSGKRRAQRGTARDAHAGWTSAARPSASTAAHTAAADLSPAEAAEQAALARVGVRRQRRWLNDKLLIDMAPPLTVEAMQSLFQPVPFGDTGHVSAFTLAAAPEHAPLWELFRSVDADKQQRVLAKWEEHVQELRRTETGNSTSGHDAVDAAAAAVHAWSAVNDKARRALRRAPMQCVEELEAQISAFAATASPGQELALPLEDAFQRLLVHGLAQFHALHSFGRTGHGGCRQVVARQPALPAAALEENARGLGILCTDVLWLLEEGVQDGLSAKRLHEAVFGSHHMEPAAVPGVTVA